MKTLPKELFEKYVANPYAMDEAVRKYCNLPEDKYYTVSTWPVQGNVSVSNQNRVVKVKKISKSDK